MAPTAGRFTVFRRSEVAYHLPPRSGNNALSKSAKVGSKPTGGAKPRNYFRPRKPNGEAPDCNPGQGVRFVNEAPWRVSFNGRTEDCDPSNPGSTPGTRPKVYAGFVQ